ncbi:MAG: flagellar hook protein FlgE [Holophagaceae bacterium]|nr:flagellar hook protein FlgE [Holophagaceae bacterium]
MGIASAFYTALSGLSVNSSSLTVIGNNLANLNTIGFKGSSTTFQDLFSANLGASAFQGNGNPSQVGLGAQVGAVMQNFGQSTFQSTSNVMDMAVQGAGFFYMRLINGGFGHTRSGNFTIDQNGFVVDPAGNKLQGYNRTAAGKIDAAMGAVDIKLPMGETISAVATKAISFTTNLNADVARNESKYTTSVGVYDSLGSRHQLLITYEKTADNEWRYYVWAPDVDPAQTAALLDAGPAAGGHVTALGSNNPPTTLPDNINLATATWGDDYFTLAEGIIHFSSSGAMTHVEPLNLVTGAPAPGVPAGGVPLNATPPAFPNAAAIPGYLDSNGNPLMEIKWSNGSLPHAWDAMAVDDTRMTWTLNTGNIGEPFPLITQTSTESGTSNSSQNGFGAGTIKGLTVDQNGFVIGTFSNGQTFPVARVAMSIFTNNNGLQKVGENIWKETIASGPANIGTANDVGRGSILGSHLEMSNVDVADEFTRLIITQRGYQANSRIVTTSDEMMQETLALKR